MTTAIPPTVFSRIVQTNSSPETTVALLNKEEALHSEFPRHLNARRVYPFWKVCKVCLKPFQCHNRTQAIRNKVCSRTCLLQRMTQPRIKKPLESRSGMVKITCAVCGRDAWKARSWIKNVRKPTCSRQCNGKLRGEEWGKHAYKAAAAITEAGKESRRVKMSGANNPAWKGGVTYINKHGQYGSVKYVRCPTEFLPMARKDGYVMEHRLLVAQAIGRCLTRKESVHHEDHNPTNNTLSNLTLFASNRDHKLYEHHGSPEPIWRGSNLSIIQVRCGASEFPPVPS